MKPSTPFPVIFLLLLFCILLAASTATAADRLPAEKLRSVLGITEVNYLEHNHSLAITDMPLMEAAQ